MSSVRARLLAAAAIALCVPTFAHSQGFGLIKKNVALYRTLPPAVSLSNARVAVRLTGMAGKPSSVTDLLRAKLVPLVFSDKTVVEDNANPDRVIEVSLTEFYSKTSVDPQDRARVVQGTIRASYRTIDNRSKQSLDARNVAYDYDKRFAAAAAAQPKAQQPRSGFLGTLGGVLGQAVTPSSNDAEQPPTVEQLTTLMVDGLATQIAQRVVLTRQRLDVPLPRGKLDAASGLGESGRWGAMLEQLEQLAPLPGPDDAYRRYGIGVANEALAYVEEDRGKQRDLIARASQEYKVALGLKPNDDLLKQAEDRIAQSLSALDQTASIESVAAAGGQSGSSSGASRGSSDATTWDNAAVIELFKEGFKETELVDAIKSAKSPRFDVDSPAGLLQLKRAGIPERVVGAMREQMRTASN